MKHKLNLNEPGGRLFGIALVLLAIAISLSGLAWVLGRLAIQAAWMDSLAGLLAGTGLILLLVLGIFLVVEAYQDRAMEASYRT